VTAGEVSPGASANAAPSPSSAPSASAAPPAYPALYQLNTRVWLTARSRELGRPATLDDIPDAELDRLAGLGFDWVWLLSVWRLGPASRAISLSDPALRPAFAATLPDLTDDDIGGSGFAIAAYEVSPALGGDDALARLRARMAARGLRLMLDFVPNHMALDHPWALSHPDRFVQGTEADLLREPRNWTTVTTAAGGEIVVAHGRDPYFPGWTDTLQLDYGNPATVEAMTAEFASVADRCDAVRCDMAMLLLPDVFERTWGHPALPFWPEAIRQARAVHPGFVVMAEVYWDLEGRMLGEGFDDAYDKRLYDRLVAGAAGPVRDHLRADVAYQRHLARFLENHDEPRAAATFSPERHEAAALVTYLTPGLRFFHQGQLEGFRKQISPHLVRGPDEPVNGPLSRFYVALLDVVRDPLVRDGAWRLLEVAPAWDGNPTAEGFVAFAWHLGERRLVVVVNLGSTQGQVRVVAPLDDLRGTSVRLVDRLDGRVFERDADELAARGLFVDLPSGGHHVLEAEAD
jgi:hypothetical protein